MDFLNKYDGNIHPDEWINDIQKHFELKQIVNNDNYYIKSAVLLVDSTISLPTGIDTFEKLSNALKEDISFTIFKNSNKRKLQSLKYIHESKGGDTSKFISIFRKLCYNAEINDIEEQKRYLYKSLPMNRFSYISNEFYEKMKNVKSISELIKEFDDFVADEYHLITNESIVTLRHVATGKYLSSITSLYYVTGSKKQLVYAEEPGPNSSWKIEFNKELATYNDTLVKLRHIKSGTHLGIRNYPYRYSYRYHKSPSTEHTEVCCGEDETDWKFKHSKLENHQGYLKSNDTINLSIKKKYDYGQVEFLRSHDVQFTVGNDTFQEVVCHKERLGGNDEWCIELLNEV